MSDPSPTTNPAPAGAGRRALCFGEILWDFLPDGLFPGGAPFNVAYHLHRLGLTTYPVSSVGDDVLGRELLRRLRDWKIPVDLIATDPARPTGYVRAAITATGDAHYDIVRDVAWDAIPAPTAALALAASTDVLVFGSLAARSPENRATLHRLLAALPATAWRVFDINLRAPFDDLAVVAELAAHATVLKLNAAEAARLAGATESPGSEETHARNVQQRFAVPLVVVTAADRGAGLLRDDHWHWETARPVAVADTVGAGDAFLARLIAGLLARASEPRILAAACRLGEWVAAQRGATPAYTSATPSA
ncbi:carbohydrate kinase [Horticoccus luteus]|uniref:Carbohydrate kinase n=1 Tax=Horticoccus luteus TaxID=2862869 RepID=A0A8F9XKI0_9BACT|nr:PfkB family carbohydrate kinase [Horticoccus luteus]QYM78221.1 carbohydrate kinase [Horticoccus luteus]